MNPHNYNIGISLKEIEGDSIYVGTAVEFPDVRVYEEDPASAYQQVVAVIEDLVAMTEKMGHEVPVPVQTDDEIYSGKMTFRPGKDLHKRIAEAASRDGQSQNQLLCSMVSAGLVERTHAASIPDMTALIQGSLNAAIISRTLESTPGYLVPRAFVNISSGSASSEEDVENPIESGSYEDTDFNGPMGLVVAQAQS